jgi:hypothetical protein
MYLLLVLVFGCQSTPNSANRHSPLAFAERDYAVISQVFADFALQSGTYRTKRRGSLIVVNERSEAWQGDEANRIQYDLQYDKVNLDNDILMNLRERNRHRLSVKKLARIRNVLLVNLELRKGLSTWTSLRDKYPKAAAFVFLLLPGYGRDGKLAAVRFYFGPSRHGATGTYLLQHTANGWTVKSRSIVYRK